MLFSCWELGKEVVRLHDGRGQSQTMKELNIPLILRTSWLTSGLVILSCVGWVTEAA
jgi:hypothetical protein